MDWWYIWKIQRGWISYKEIPFWYYFKLYRDYLNRCTLPQDISTYKESYKDSLRYSFRKDTSTLDRWDLGLSCKAVFSSLVEGRITGALYAIECIKCYPGKTVKNDKFIYMHSEEKGITTIRLKENQDIELKVITVPPRQVSLATADTIIAFLKEHDC